MRTRMMAPRAGLAALLATIAVVTTVAISGPAQAASTRWSIEGADVHLSGWGHGMVLDAVDRGTADGTPVQMWPRRPLDSVPTEKNQRWWFDKGPATSTIVNANAPGMCLDESAPRDGAPVYLYHCTGAANQQWQYVQADENAGVWESTHYFWNKQDGRCLDVKDWNTAQGARLQVYECRKVLRIWNQRFNLTNAHT